MASHDIHIRYNRATHRWEVIEQGNRLPDFTSPSKDAAMIEAIHLAKNGLRREITVFDENDAQFSVLEIRYGA